MERKRENISPGLIFFFSETQIDLKKKKQNKMETKRKCERNDVDFKSN